jgi:hypothetical protein
MNDYEDLIFLYNERSRLIKYLYEIDGKISILCNDYDYSPIYDNDYYRKRNRKLSKTDYLKNLETKNTKNIKKIKNIRNQKQYSKAKTFDMMAKRYYKSSII